MLDNPIWNSLATRHASMAIRHGQASRYPAQVTPFVSVSRDDPSAELDLRRIVEPGERIGILSVVPPMEDRWTLEKSITIYQFLWPEELETSEDAGVVKLCDQHIPSMIEITQLVYPAYFRPETARLGDYFGIIRDGRLAAMAGVRMSMDGYQELSAICTHPDYRRCGYAERLTRHLVHHIRSQGDQAFLHTESDNVAAQALYLKVGFVLRKELPFQVLTRKES